MATPKKSEPSSTAGPSSLLKKFRGFGGTAASAAHLALSSPSATRRRTASSASVPKTCAQIEAEELREQVKAKEAVVALLRSRVAEGVDELHDTEQKAREIEEQIGESIMVLEACVGSSDAGDAPIPGTAAQYLARMPQIRRRLHRRQQRDKAKGKENVPAVGHVTLSASSRAPARPTTTGTSTAAAAAGLPKAPATTRDSTTQPEPKPTAIAREQSAWSKTAAGNVQESVSHPKVAVASMHKSRETKTLMAPTAGAKPGSQAGRAVSSTAPWPPRDSQPVRPGCKSNPSATAAPPPPPSRPGLRPTSLVKPPAGAASEPVTLHIYDVSGDTKVQWANEYLRPVGTGAFHAGVEVYGQEWSFGFSVQGTGVCCCKPRFNEQHSYREAVPMGRTPLSEKAVAQLLAQLSEEWVGTDYDLLVRNCCHFSDAFCRALGVGPVPEWVTNLAGAGAVLRGGVSLAVAGAGAAATLAAAKAAELDEQYQIQKKVEHFNSRLDAFAMKEIEVAEYEEAAQETWHAVHKHISNAQTFAEAFTEQALAELEKPIDMERVEAAAADAWQRASSALGTLGLGTGGSTARSGSAGDEATAGGGGFFSAVSMLWDAAPAATQAPSAATKEAPAATKAAPATTKAPGGPPPRTAAAPATGPGGSWGGGIQARSIRPKAVAPLRPPLPDEGLLSPPSSPVRSKSAAVARKAAAQPAVESTAAAAAEPARE